MSKIKLALFSNFLPKEQKRLRDNLKLKNVLVENVKFKSTEPMVRLIINGDGDDASSYGHLICMTKPEVSVLIDALQKCANKI
jgi:hypothetical protein